MNSKRSDTLHINEEITKFCKLLFWFSDFQITCLEKKGCLSPTNLLQREELGNYLRWPLLAMEASGFGVPFRAASCCSTALESKYSSHAAASCNLHPPSPLLSTDRILTISSQSALWKTQHIGQQKLPTICHESVMNEPVCGGHQDQVLLAKFAELSVHAEHSESMPPSRRVQLQWHGSLQLSVLPRTPIQWLSFITPTLSSPKSMISVL